MHMSPSLNGSSVLDHFECTNAIEIRNGYNVRFLPETAQYMLWIIEALRHRLIMYVHNFWLNVKNQGWQLVVWAANKRLYVLLCM